MNDTVLWSATAFCFLLNSKPADPSISYKLVAVCSFLKAPKVWSTITLPAILHLRWVWEWDLIKAPHFSHSSVDPRDAVQRLGEVFSP